MDEVKLTVIPIPLRVANAYVLETHRHHKPVRGCKFCIAVVDADGKMRGVAIIGRPVARRSDDGFTAEVNRLCTDGARNACSKLYRAAWRAAAAMGHHRLITFTLPEEGGASLRGAGFKLTGTTPGQSWNVSSRPRDDKHPIGEKLRWELAA